MGEETVGGEGGGGDEEETARVQVDGDDKKTEYGDNYS